MELMSGNEAIAQGAWEAGVTIGVAYPGTPSTETLQELAKKDDIYAEWCTNEKVALEVGLGASAAGARVLVAMKHVGVNVAADPLFTASYTGVNGGIVILAADDPGMHSSQNEQDSHYYGLAARVPVLDPSDSQEALQFTRDAFDLSEKFDVPVIMRSSVRVSHTKTPVTWGSRRSIDPTPYTKDAAKWVMIPAFARPRRLVQLDREARMREWVETCEFNKLIRRGAEVGVICAGSAFQHVVEALPDATVLKLGVTWPLPHDALHQLASEVEKLYVIEEGSDYLLNAVRACGVQVEDTPSSLPRYGELSPGLIRTAFGYETPSHAPARTDLPNRPPALCAGCPHRVVFKELSRIRAVVVGDIGCYTLAVLPPLAAMDTCVDMGASISMAHGMELALSNEDHRPIVAVIGDSTFAHSGLSSLISTVYNCGTGTICILDNRTTAMTGQQGNPFNGVTLQARRSRELNLERLISSLGIEDVRVIDPNVPSDVRNALKDATSSDTLSVLIFRSPCIMLDKNTTRKPYAVNGKCTACGVCSTLGCPAISKDSNTGIAFIDRSMCVGCGQCSHYCRFDAISLD